MKLSFAIIALLFTLAIAIPTLYEIDEVAIYNWDEGRNALNAYEMYHNGNYIVRTIHGQPETYETKPPLLIWLQVLGFSIFGFNEWAIRFPSILAVFGTVLLFIYFSKKVLHSWQIGVFSSLALVSAGGYMRFHVARTGDHDALLLFFLVGGFFFFYQWLCEKENKTRNALILAFFLICGILTKSIMGFAYVPGMALSALVFGKLSKILKSPQLYMILLLVVGTVFSYYLLRESLQPGYIDYVVQGELWQRYANTSDLYEFQERDPWYYLRQLVNRHFRILIYLVPACMIAAFWIKDKDIRRFTLSCSITAILFFLFISNGTRNEWYDAPLLPLFSLIVGVGLHQLVQLITKYVISIRQDQKIWLGILMAILLFIYPYSLTFKNEIANPYIDRELSAYGNFMERIAKNYPDVKDYFLYSHCNSSSAHFYRRIYNEQRGYRIRYCTPCQSIHDCHIDSAGVGDLVMVCNHNFHLQLGEQYTLDTLLSKQNCSLLNLKSRLVPNSK